MKNQAEKTMDRVYALPVNFFIGFDPKRVSKQPTRYWVGLAREPDIGMAK
jgi:hypothetical protein